MSEALFQVEGLVKSFGVGEAETHVLRGLSLRMAQGELATLLGPSGSGKSTLLTILGTLMHPTSGSHSMLGVDLTAASDRALTEFRNRHIGFVFQFHNLLPDFTALENVIFPTAVQAGRETPAARAGRSCWSGWGWPTACIFRRRTCRADRSSGWQWRGR
jgi:lipoprotein-releasing system ATP-binding protein